MDMKQQLEIQALYNKGFDNAGAAERPSSNAGAGQAKAKRKPGRPRKQKVQDILGSEAQKEA